MKTYAKVSEGFVVSTCVSDVEQMGMVEVDFQMDNQPSAWHKFNIETKAWVDFTPCDFVQSEVKKVRNELLSNSDWTQLFDVSVPNKADWATYRQALRDIPDQQGYPENVIWPIAPQ
jgi:hypothetical protein